MTETLLRPLGADGTAFAGPPTVIGGLARLPASASRSPRRPFGIVVIIFGKQILG